MTRLARRLGVGVVVLAFVLAGCGGPEPAEQARTTSPSASPTPTAPSQGAAYVSIGDSYTSGGPIGEYQPDGFRCQRSSRNYPSLVAETLELALTDVSCGGATTDDVLAEAKGLPAQIDAVTSDTRVVTVGIGGNNFDLYSYLLGTCQSVSKPGGKGAPCRDQIASKTSTIVVEIGAQISDVLATVRSKAPGAEIVLVGYPRLMPPDDSCTQTPYTAGDVNWISSVESDLAAAMARAAADENVTFVEMYRRSKGHDLCSGDDAWVNGLQPAEGDGALLHPNATGQRALADAVTQALRATSIA